MGLFQVTRFRGHQTLSLSGTISSTPGLSWISQPAPVFDGFGTVAYAFSSLVSNYSALTDEFRVNPSGTQLSGANAWLSLSGATLVPNGTQTDTSDFQGLILDVRRSGGEWVSSGPFAVNVTSPWTALPTPSFAEETTTSYNLGQKIRNYNSVTDTFTVQAGYFLPAWLTQTGTGGVNLTSNGSQLDANDFTLSIGVSRSGGPVVYSGAFAVNVTAAAAQPVASGNRANLWDTDFEGVNRYEANNLLKVRWVNQYGDWRDFNNTAQGTTAFASMSVTTFSGIQTKTFTGGNIYALVQRLVSENTGFRLRVVSGTGTVTIAGKGHTSPAPTLSVTTTVGPYSCPLLAATYIVGDTGTWVTPPTTLSSDAMLKFDLSAVQGIVTDATLTVTVVGYGGSPPATLGLFYLDMPTIITDPAQQVGGIQIGAAAQVSRDIDLDGRSDLGIVVYDKFDSLTEIKKGNLFFASQTAGSFNAWTQEPAYISWPEYGITAGRAVVKPVGGNAFKMYHIHFPASVHANVCDNAQGGFEDNPLVPPDRPWTVSWGNGPTERYFRYMLYIDPDVAVQGAMYSSQQGRLPGIEGAFDPFGKDGNTIPDANSWFGYRVHHTHPSRANPGVFGVYLYQYDWEFNVLSGGGTGYATIPNVVPNFCFEAGRKYSIEWRVKLNTTSDGWVTPNADGIYQVWVDGVLIWSKTDRKIINAAVSRINEITIQVLNGSTHGPNSDLHYEIAAAALSTSYVGPPQPALPLWARTIEGGNPATVGKWYSVANTAQSLVGEPATMTTPTPPGLMKSGNQTARLGSWCGPAFRKRGSVLVMMANGGHGDYPGNWGTHVTLGADVPAVEIIDQGTHWQDFRTTDQTDQSGVVYHAGPIPKPRATHNYYSHIFCDERDWFMYFDLQSGDSADYGMTQVSAGYQYSRASYSPSTNGVAVYDYAARTWLAPNTVTPMVVAGNGEWTAQMFVTHPVTGDIYYGRLGETRVYKWTQATNTYAALQNASYPVNYQAHAIDPQRNRIFCSGQKWLDNVIGGSLLPAGYRARTIDLSTGTSSNPVLSGPSADIVEQAGRPGYPGMVYVPQLGKYLFGINTSAVGSFELHQVDAGTFECTPYTTTGTIPSAAINGVLTKMHFAPELRGLVLMNQYAENVKYLRLY